MNYEYLAILINSTIRSTTPILYVALASAICNRVGVFNIALEAQMLIGSFVAVAVNFFTGSVIVSIMAAMISGGIIGSIVAILQVKHNGADMVIGTSMNLLVGGVTSILLSVIFGVRGSFSHPDLVSISRVSLPIINQIPLLGDVLRNLTIYDYLSYLLAFFLYLYLFKTVSGLHLRSIGINDKAAESLGVDPLKIRITTVIISGVLCGIGGAILSIGQVTLFTEGMTAGRGYIALAASNMGGHHPLFVVLSSLFFGASTSIGSALQGTYPSQLTMAIPYVFTVLALALTGFRNKKNKNSISTYFYKSSIWKSILMIVSIVN